MMIKVLIILVVVVPGILCSGTQQGSSAQTGQSLQIQPNVRKYNKHTSTESSTTGTRKDKPENSDAQDYVQIGGNGAPVQGYPYPYPYPYPYQPVGPAPGGVVLVQPGGNPYRVQYPYEPQYPVDGSQYYGPYYPAAPSSPPYAPLQPYNPAAYPAPPPQPLQQYEQATVVDAYRGPLPPYPQTAAEQSQFFRQPAVPFASPPYYYGPQPHFRAHAYGRPPVPQAFLQQRDVTGGATTNTATASAPPANSAANNAEPQYEQQQSGPFDGNQYHF